MGYRYSSSHAHGIAHLQATTLLLLLLPMCLMGTVAVSLTPEQMNLLCLENAVLKGNFNPIPEPNHNNHKPEVRSH